VTSPKILAVSWGRMEVEGLPVGKDFRRTAAQLVGGLFHSTCRSRRGRAGAAGRRRLADSITR
jgi:hypothetical protein